LLRERLPELPAAGSARDFFHSLLAAYRTGEVRGQPRRASLGGLACDAVSDRHWIVWGRLP
jgi:hypothetical protein